MLQEIKSMRGGLDAGKQLIEDNDERNFNLDILGGFFGGYEPKYEEKIIQTLSVKDQGGVSSCVTQSAAVAKEVDEGVILSPSDLGSFLVSKGQMNEGGTSIQAAIKAEIERGIAEESVVPTRNTTFGEFSSPANLTQKGKESAAIHASKSFWTTRTLSTILEQIDNGKPGRTGMHWKLAYGAGGVLRPVAEEAAFGHAVTLKGYKLNHQAGKVLVFQNSWGRDWGSGGDFFVRFEDFLNIVNFNVYFVLDIEPNLAQWLSLNAGKVIKSNDSNKCFAIVGNEKRWVFNEPILVMLGYELRDIVADKENILPKLKEGEPLTITDIPPVEQETWKEAVRLMQNPYIRAEFIKTLNM